MGNKYEKAKLDLLIKEALDTKKKQLEPDCWNKKIIGVGWNKGNFVSGIINLPCGRCLYFLKFGELLKGTLTYGKYATDIGYYKFNAYRNIEKKKPTHPDYFITGYTKIKDIKKEVII